MKQRGLNADVAYYFIIDGSKALRTAIEAVFGEKAPGAAAGIRHATCSIGSCLRR